MRLYIQWLIAVCLMCIMLPIAFARNAETERIYWHLSRTSDILEKVDTSHLSPEQRQNRSNMLEVLRQYTKDEKYPNNDKFPWEYVPFFRGSNGNLCAVGYLMNQDVEYQDFVEQVVNTNNNVKIMDIQDDATVNVWADTYGFSIVELAMIQPTYGACWGTYQLYGCSTLETIKLFARELKEASSPSEISDLREQFFRTLFPPFLLLVIIPIIASIYAIKKGVDIKKVSITLLVCFFIFIFFKHY